MCVFLRESSQQKDGEGFKVTERTGGQSGLCQQWRIVMFDDENKVKQKHEGGMKRQREREKGGGKEWNNEKWTQESSRDRNRQIDIISDTCRELFSARTEAGSVRESILRGEWKHLCQPTGIWLTLQKAARPLGTCLYSVGLFFLLVVFYGKNMFLRIPSSMGRENIFLVFSMPGAESWKHFSFPKKKWEKKKKSHSAF